MSRYAYHLAGRTYNELGTVLESPPFMKATMHIQAGGAKRGGGRQRGGGGRTLSSAEHASAIADPIIVLDQYSRNTAFINEKGMVILDYQGDVIEKCTCDGFDEKIRNILTEAGFNG